MLQVTNFLLFGNNENTIQINRIFLDILARLIINLYTKIGLCF